MSTVCEVSNHTKSCIRPVAEVNVGTNHQIDSPYGGMQFYFK